MDQQTWERLSTSRAPLRERIGTYCVGVAIGFGLLGMLWMMRSQAARSGQASPGVTPGAASGGAAVAPGAAAGGVQKDHR